ncbi:MAG: tyrosine-type recombinase/integrase [Acidobacteriota bacterium]|nr:tyrosine-type recombinase/integrase [Acidobacteriota bacterium]
MQAQSVVATPTFEDLAAQFLEYLTTYRRASPHTVEAYRRDLRRFGDFIERGHLPQDPGRIGTQVIQAFAISIGHLAPASVNRVLNATSSFFGWLGRQGVVDSNPVAAVERPRIPEQVPTAPTVAQAQALLAAAKTPRERSMVMLLACCGLRRSELLNLNLRDVAADLSNLVVRCGKGQRDRVVPIPGQCQEALRLYLADRGGEEGPVFGNGAGNRIGNTEFYRIFDRLLRRADLEGAGITPHSLRHFFASQLLRGRADIETVRSLCGHADLRTTSRYCHSDDETRVAAVNRLPLLTLDGDTRIVAAGDGEAA